MAFYASSLTSVTIPEGVTIIGDYAFEGRFQPATGTNCTTCALEDNSCADWLADKASAGGWLANA
jgi:hypothetical protein